MNPELLARLMAMHSNRPQAANGRNGVPNRYLPPQHGGNHGQLPVYGYGANGHPFHNLQNWLHSAAYQMGGGGAPPAIGPEHPGNPRLPNRTIGGMPGPIIGGQHGGGMPVIGRPPFAGGSGPVLGMPGGRPPIAGGSGFGVMQPLLRNALMMRALGR